MSRIPAGAQTYSKCRSQLPANAPDYAVRGDGAKVLCSDGRRYTDWTAALGPVVLGYRHSDVDDAVIEQVRRGPNFGLPSGLEESTAELLCSLVPGMEKVRFGKGGGESCAAAVRAARAITGRLTIVSVGYHGWHAEVGGGPNKSGVLLGNRREVMELEETRAYLYDSQQVAAYIIEPDRYLGLDYLRSDCDRTGALLIFDEVLTGFRLALGGATSHYGVIPDLAVFSKAMGNGYSVSAVAGSARAMEPFAGGIGYSTTFAGETIGLAAASATMSFMRDNPVIEHLAEIGKTLQDGWNATAKELGLDIPCEGHPSRTVIRYPSLEAKTLVLEKMWEQGQMFTTGFTSTWSHTTKDVDVALDAARAALLALASGEKPKGRLCGPVFRQS